MHRYDFIHVVISRKLAEDKQKNCLLSWSFRVNFSAVYRFVWLTLWKYGHWSSMLSIIYCDKK